MLRSCNTVEFVVINRHQFEIELCLTCSHLRERLVSVSLRKDDSVGRESN